MEQNSCSGAILVGKEEMELLINKIADSIIEEFSPLYKEKIALLGIQTKGALFAQRLLTLIKKKTSVNVLFGTVDITMYRDDIGLKRHLPEIHETNINFDVNGQNLILVDDVLETGRTIRAALDAVTDYGRPALIRLAILIDRGHREFPIRADYIGIHKQIPINKKIKTYWTETHGEDAIYTL